MKCIFKKMIDFLNKGKYTTNEEAAGIIRRLADNQFDYPLEWDDFESLKEENSEADIALDLCIFFAKKYPGNKTALSCNEKVCLVFLKIADTLEDNGFSNLNFGKTKELLRQGILSEELRSMLSVT